MKFIRLYRLYRRYGFRRSLAFKLAWGRGHA